MPGRGGTHKMSYKIYVFNNTSHADDIYWLMSSLLYVGHRKHVRLVTTIDHEIHKQQTTLHITGDSSY
jgi:hypothetical protein